MKSATLRAALVNVRTRNRRHDLVLALLREEDPDLVIIEEANGRWLKALEPLEDTHPHRVSYPSEDNTGITLYSKLPLSSARVTLIGGVGLPSIVAQVSVQGRPLTVLGTHPARPGNARSFRARNEQLEAVAAWCRDEVATPLLVLGDLNVTPWSPHFKELLRISGLHDSSLGRGYQPTWPAPLWLLPFRIPIDHCLHGEEIAVVRRKVGSDVGSDHRPLIVDVAFR